MIEIILVSDSELYFYEMVFSESVVVFNMHDIVGIRLLRRSGLDVTVLRVAV